MGNVHLFGTWPNLEYFEVFWMKCWSFCKHFKRVEIS